MSLALPHSVSVATARDSDVAMITSAEGFLALRAEWDGLAHRAGRPEQVFQQHVFLRHWLAHYGPGGGLRIVAVRRGGRLTSLWPFTLRGSPGLRTLVPMGAPVAQFADILHDPAAGPDVLAEGWQALRRTGADLVWLRRVRADCVLAELPALVQAGPTERDTALRADLVRRVDGAAPGPAYSPRERSNHRRRLRRLAERGQLTFEAAPNDFAAATLARRAVAMKRAALERHGVLAPTVTDPRFAAFFADLAADPESGLGISVIRCDGAPIGIDLSLDWMGTTFGHVIATHPDHERGGLGQVLIQHSFAQARARGSAVFDLLAPADAYKRDHADGGVAVADYLLPLSLTGRLAVAAGLGGLRPLMKRVAKALPAGLARRLAKA